MDTVAERDLTTARYIDQENTQSRNIVFHQLDFIALYQRQHSHHPSLLRSLSSLKIHLLHKFFPSSASASLETAFMDRIFCDNQFVFISFFSVTVRVIN